jgi:hypothetical protein
MATRYGAIFVAAFLALHARADIVGMWLFEEGAGDVAVDVSGRGHDGALTDGVKWVNGTFGGGVEFDATGFIEWEHHEDFNFDENLTFMFHARIDAITPQEWVGMPRKENEYTMAAHTAGANMEMTLWLNIGGAWIGQIPAAGVFPAHAYGDWHHYAATYDGATVRLHLDGEPAGDMAVAGSINQTDAPMRVSNSCCGGRFMEGAVDEYVLANHTMTQDEIAEFATKGVELTLAVDAVGKLPTAWADLKASRQR